MKKYLTERINLAQRTTKIHLVRGLNFFDQEVSFRAKTMIVIMLTSGMAILLVMLLTLLFANQAIREGAVEAVGTHGDVIAANSRAVLAFQVRDAAGETLGALRKVPGIVAASIYKKDRSAFASYARDGETLGPMPYGEDVGHVFHGLFLDVIRPVELNGERIGTIVLRYDMKIAYEQLKRQGIIDAVMGLLALTGAFFLGTLFQRRLTQPLVELERTARAVSLSQDYKVRAKKYSNDELGRLTDAFNKMLAQIQARGNALAEVRDRLEEQVVERTMDLEQAKNAAEQAAADLQESEACVRSILENAVDGIITFNEEGRIELFNPAAERIFNYLQEEVIDHSVNELLSEEVTLDQDGRLIFVNEMGDIERLGNPAEIYVRKRGGAALPIQIGLSKVALNGRVMITAIVRDISERRRAEQEKEDLNRQLVYASRRSGMAEVATGVLHNVGNVLNSVNVSASMLMELAKKSSIDRLNKIVDLFCEQGEGLGKFMAEDERVKVLPDYLNKLSETLHYEREKYLEEAKMLMENVQHIKEIISVQQSNANAGGLYEDIKISKLVEDAIRINNAALQRHHIKIVRRFEVEPFIKIDKNKVLQILINLVNNAKNAMRNQERDKILTVEIQKASDRSEHVCICVSDNGHGILREHLVKIFQYGFTTRKDGHGYGLHNSALAAKMMGGALRVESEGEGRGATFVLELPITDATRRNGTKR